MTVRECYSAMEGDYEDALGRLLDDARITRFVLKFLNDDSFDKLCQAMEEKQYEEAFRAAHNLKGISANLSFAGLFSAADELTENLRGGQCDEHSAVLMEKVKEKYCLTKQAILALQATV